jgi:small subunit ribosomal protein S8e
MLSQHRSKRKVTGGRYKSFRKKRKCEMGREPTLTKLGKTRQKKFRTKGTGIKMKLLSCDVANVFDPKANKYSKAKIKTVVENPANRHYVRRNIITKGTVIDTELGKARVTSRPGQTGTINAVLI